MGGVGRLEKRNPIWEAALRTTFRRKRGTEELGMTEVYSLGDSEMGTVFTKSRLKGGTCERPRLGEAVSSPAVRRR